MFRGAAISSVFFAAKAVAAAATTIEIVNPINTDSFAKIVENTILFALEVAGSIALFMLIAGGVMYITSSGDEQKVAAAKKIFNFTIIGLAVVLLSYSIIKVISDVFEVW